MLANRDLLLRLASSVSISFCHFFLGGGWYGDGKVSGPNVCGGGLTAGDSEAGCGPGVVRARERTGCDGPPGQSSALPRKPDPWRPLGPRRRGPRGRRGYRAQAFGRGPSPPPGRAQVGPASVWFAGGRRDLPGRQDPLPPASPPCRPGRSRPPRPPDPASAPPQCNTTNRRTKRSPSQGRLLPIQKRPPGTRRSRAVGLLGRAGSPTRMDGGRAARRSGAKPPRRRRTWAPGPARTERRGTGAGGGPGGMRGGSGGAPGRGAGAWLAA